MDTAPRSSFFLPCLQARKVQPDSMATADVLPSPTASTGPLSRLVPRVQGLHLSRSPSITEVRASSQEHEYNTTTGASGLTDPPAPSSSTPKRARQLVDFSASSMPIDLGDVRPRELPLHLQLAHTLKIKTPSSARRKVSLICLVDVSGSMGSLADGGSQEKSAFTCLDLAKHSLRVLASSLDESDSLALITFNSKAKLVFQTSGLNAAELSRAEETISRMEAGGGTNIWDAISMAMGQAEKAKDEHVTILLLTDGEPSSEPSEGTAAAFRKSLARTTNSVSLHTLGYGYGVKSPLLTELAQAGSGVYSFIPDATMVGSVFVNFISGLLATAYHRIVLVVKSANKFEVPGQRALAIEPKFAPKGTRAYDLGPLQAGQERSVCILSALPWRGDVAFYAASGTDMIKWTKLVEATPIGDVVASAQGTVDCCDALARALTFLAINAIMDDPPRRHERVKSLGEQLKFIEGLAPSSAFLKALVEDVTSPDGNQGQIGHAVEKDEWFVKWGMHYLPSAGRAHELQFCMNFKDASMQYYASDCFNSIQGDAEALFCTMPAPKATGIVRSSHSYGSGSSSYSPPVSMASYYDRSGGCFYANNKAVVENAGEVFIKDLKRGDRVRGSDGLYHTISCVVYTPIPENTPAVYYNIGNDVLMTAYHPVWDSARDVWAFPIDIGTRALVDIEGYYNFLLDDGVDMVVQGQTCITLAHGITNSSVAAHPYLGTQRVAQDIQAMRGWKEGRVVLDGAATVRDDVTQTIVRWVEME